MIHEIDTFPGRTFQSQGKTWLYFGGTAYLGLQTLPEYQETYQNNIKIYGTGYAASGMANVRLSIYEKAATFLAKFTGNESALTVSSGYLAGQLLASYFHKPQFTCYYAPETHSSLHSINSFNAGSFDTLISEIKNHIASGQPQIPVVFFDSVISSGDNYPSFAWLKTLPLEKIILVADDSHGFGVLGPDGCGVARTLKAFHPLELIVCGSLGKGFGIQAGVICGMQKRIESLQKKEMFIASSPASPASIATLLESIVLFRQQQALLHSHIKRFHSLILPGHGLSYLKTYPVFTFSDKKLIEFLRSRGIEITSFRYPNENSDLINRIVLSAMHTERDIDILAAAINSFYQ
ncbi:aminotransferase class I/II-fold pyridoxal phosphate-dependent enzyme [Ascidiimonas aurantiaca]|uniref:aminotransferase class I/II-fold pyridoxal phosphate-dependent enzyme n=1 Tax=Ascidiimonas aurantiaca TaxID=1685432 RepID=UPI0030EB6654